MLFSVKEVTRTWFARPVWGITTVGAELFLADNQSSTVSVYDVNTFRFRRTINIPDLVLPVDMTSSRRANCLFIADGKGSAIFRIDLETDDVTRWPTADRPHGLSIDRSGQQLLVTCPESGVVWEISTADGAQRRKFQLSTQAFPKTWHSVKNPEFDSDSYFVAHGGADSPTKNRVCKLDYKTQRVEACLERFFDRLSSPIRLQTVGDKHLLVADENNQRLLMMTFELDVVWTAVSDLWGAIRLWVDASSSEETLYVVVNKWENGVFAGSDVIVYRFI